MGNTVSSIWHIGSSSTKWMMNPSHIIETSAVFQQNWNLDQTTFRKWAVLVMCQHAKWTVGKHGLVKMRVVPSYFMIAWKHSDTDIFAMWQCFHRLLLPLACAAHFWRTHFQKVSVFVLTTGCSSNYFQVARLWWCSTTKYFKYSII